MNTIFICHNYIDESFSSMSFYLANRLAEEGNRIVFISKKPYYKEEVKHYLGNGELVLTSWPSEKFSTSIKDFRWFASLFRKFKPSFVIGHHNGSITSLITSKILGRRNVKTIEYYHVCTPSFISDAKGLTARLRFFFFRKRVFYHLFCDHVICPSLFSVRDLENYYYYKKGVEIMNPLPDRFKEEPNPSRKRDLVSYLGRLDPTKNVIELIEAFNSHKAEYPNSPLKLKIAGTGILSSEVNKLCQSHKDIEFLGPIPYENVDKFLSESTFIIIPSVFDNLPTVSLEAMMLGKPLLLSSTVGTKDYLTDGRDCILFKPNKKGIKDTLDTLPSIPEKQLFSMGKNAREAYLRNFQMEKYIESMKELCGL